MDRRNPTRPARRPETSAELKRRLNALPRLTECHYCGCPVANIRWIEAHGDYLPPVMHPADEWCSGSCTDTRVGTICFPAGYSPPLGISLQEWDHKTPTRWGGADDEWNLVPACTSCNGGKCDTPYLGFLFHGARKWGDVPEDVAVAMRPSWGLGFIAKIERSR